MKHFALSVLSALALLSCKGGSSDGNTGLTWLTIEEASRIAEEGTDKKFVIDVYTQWCGWCKVMDKKTFADPEMAAYLADNFHMVKFDAEQKEPVTFKGRTYQYQQYGRSGVNELAVELLQGQMGYPSLVYLDGSLQPLRVSAGFKDVPGLRAELESLQ